MFDAKRMMTLVRLNYKFGTHILQMRRFLNFIDYEAMKFFSKYDKLISKYRKK